MRLNSRLLALFLVIPILTACQEDEFQRWEPEISAFEQADLVNPPEAGAVLFVGSSSIRIWNDIASDFPGYRLLRRGFGGSEFSDLMHYADRLVYRYEPSKIFVYEGENDIVAGESPDNIISEAITLRQEISERLGADIPVIFISVKPSVARWHLREPFQALNGMLEDYASETANTYFADVWSASLDENGQVRTDIFIEDNIHMNRKGYDIWRSVLQPFMEI